MKWIFASAVVLAVGALIWKYGLPKDWLFYGIGLFSLFILLVKFLDDL